MIKKYKKIKTLFMRRFKTTNNIMRYTFYIALGWVLLRDFWLVNYPAKFEIYATVGTFLRNLSFAYITSFLVYFINVHLQSYKLKTRNFRYINNKIVQLKGLSSFLIYSLAESAGEKYDDQYDYSKKWIEDVTLKVSPLKPVTYGRLDIKFNNYYELFSFIDCETKRLVKDLFIVKDSLDSETMMLLTFIEDCTDEHLNKSKGYKFADENLKSYSRDIYNYKTLCNELIECLYENYKYYRSEYFEFIVDKGRKEEEEKLKKELEDMKNKSGQFSI